MTGNAAWLVNLGLAVGCVAALAAAFGFVTLIMWLTTVKPWLALCVVTLAITVGLWAVLMVEDYS